MKLTQLLIVGGLAASLALPVAASAQQSPQPPYYPPQQQQQYPPQQQPGGPNQGPQQQQTTPSLYRLQTQFAKQFQNLGITGQQQQQITSLITSFAQTHPEGSPRDKRGMKELRQEILSVLTPQQQAQYEQAKAAMQVQRAQQREQRLQQQQGQAPQQGQPPYQGSPNPPQQQPPQG